MGINILLREGIEMRLYITIGMGWEWEYGHGNGIEKVISLRLFTGVILKISDK